MKRILNFIYAVIGILGVGACSTDMPVPTMEMATETTETRAPVLIPVINQKTMEVVKADLIGALEGALKGFDYAVNQNLPEEEAIGVIIINAISQGVQRSHAAYVTNFVTHNIGIASTTPSPQFDLLTMSRDAVRVAESEQVSQNRWINEDTHNLSSKYPHATLVAQTHNAMLSVSNNMENVKEFDSYEVSLQKYTPLQRAYLSSDFYNDSFMEVVREPLNFSAYDNIELYQPHYLAKSTAKSFLSSNG